MKSILPISYLSRAVTCCFTGVAFFPPVFEATAWVFHSLGKCTFRSPLKSVLTNCDVSLMPRERIYCVRSPIKNPWIPPQPWKVPQLQPIGCSVWSQHWIFVLPLCICSSPQLERRQCMKQFFVLVCCYLILGQSSRGVFCLSRGTHHPGMACALHLGGQGILLPPKYTYRKIQMCKCGELAFCPQLIDEVKWLLQTSTEWTLKFFFWTKSSSISSDLLFQIRIYSLVYLKTETLQWVFTS